MNKTIKYAKNGAISGGIVMLLLNLFKQLSRLNKEKNTAFDWQDLLFSTGKGALIGGSSGAIIGGARDIVNSYEKPLNTSALLNSIILTNTLVKKDYSYNWLSNKALKIEHFISSNFKNQLGGTILRIGSTEENTALADNFDIDITVPFASDSFFSTEDMFYELYCFFKSNFNDDYLFEIRPQKKSIGIIFHLDGQDFKIDIVPYKLSPKKDNKTSGYLFVNNNSIFKKDSYTKTDISSLKGIRLTPTQQKILVAIKIWKKEYSVPLSSHLAKLLIIDAYKANSGTIPRDFTKKLLMVINHIKNEINYKRIVSVENTNNVLTDIKETKKEQIREACNEVIEEYEYQPNSILEYFTKVSK